MGTGIIVCGCNGSGKSSLAKELAKKLNYKFIDIEDYYFPEKNADYIYDYARPRSEAESILISEIEKCDNFVLAAVKGDFGNKANTLYKYAIFISVPKQIRLQRVKDRSFQKFGNRMLPDGDLYEKEKRFFDMVALRTEQDIQEWLHSINCCIIQVDGTKPIEKNVELIYKELLKN